MLFHYYYQLENVLFLYLFLMENVLTGSFNRKLPQILESFRVKMVIADCNSL